MKNFKIYILPVEKKFMPEMSNHIYPFRNKTSYGVEQDFFVYLNKHPELLTSDPQEADWHYLPIFWFNFYYRNSLNNVSKVQHQVDLVIIDSKKTFTICQYNLGILVDAGETVLFLSSRKSKKGVDIPLLCDKHQVPTLSCKKYFLASFVGVMHTHKIRKELKTYFEKDKRIRITYADRNVKLFVNTMLGSYIALCPRGTGGSSFRFYEAMDLGVVPFLIGDTDVRPFKKFIDWDSISFFSSDVKGVEKVLDKYRNDSKKSLEKGSKAKQFFEDNLCYQKWCKYVLKELECIKEIQDAY